MQLQLAVRHVFGQLTESLRQLHPNEYLQSCQTLSGNTIGQHVRHIIELFQVLENGYEPGLVNYENRKRDKIIEKDIDLAIYLLEQIIKDLNRPDKPLMLEASYDELSGIPFTLQTNFFREIVYNLEHTIHHMALIRIGMREICPHLILAENYGIASSTIKYRRQCAQ
ncbi:hypothetical protein ACX0G9_27135 [Flavitalea flava]